MNKNYIAVVGSFFLSEFGRSMYFVTVSWMLYQMTNDALYTGVLISIGFLPGLLLNLVIGVIVDRLNRKNLTLIALLINTIAMMLLFIVIATDSLQPWHILFVHMVLQLMGSLFRPAIQALIAEAFHKKQLPKIFSHSSSSGISGSLLGATIGGFAMGLTSSIISMVIIIVSYLFSMILLTKVIYTPSKPTTSGGSPFVELKDGFSYLRKHPFLLNLFSVMFIGQLVFHTCIGFLSVYTIEHLEGSSFTYGLLDATLSIGGVLAGFLGTWWWRINKYHLSSNAFIITALGLLCLSLAPITPVAFIGVFLVGLGTTWVRVLLQTIQQIATEKAYHGRMASYRMLCNQGSVVISGPVVGWIATSYGISTVFLFLLIPVLLAISFSIKQIFKDNFLLIEKEVS